MANTSTRGILLTMLSAVTFGFAFTLGPMTYGEAGSNPVTLTFLRNFLSLPVLLAILWYQGVSLHVSAKELWSLTVLGGIGNAVTTLMLFIAFSLIDVGVATTIHFIYPVFVTIGCVLFYKERLGLQKFIALLIATAGIACFFLGVDMSAGFSGGTFLGLFLAVASGVTYAFYIIYMDKSGLKNQPVFKISFYCSADVLDRYGDLRPGYGRIDVDDADAAGLVHFYGLCPAVYRRGSIVAANRHQACRRVYRRYFDYLRADHQYYLRRAAVG